MATPSKAEESPEVVNELARRMIRRIEEFGTVEGFSDDDIIIILSRTKSILEPLPAMLELLSPVVVVGDIHGQLSDMLQFVKKIGPPPFIHYLFLGDYVDRSCRSMEVVLWLFCSKIMYPNAIHLLRGNHEIRRINAMYGFFEEMMRKRGRRMWKLFNDVFCELSVCANINRRILCMHGGLSLNIQCWDSLVQLKKPRRHAECEMGMNVDLMWADPNRNTDECKFNTARGISVLYGETAVQRICDSLNIELIIRGHELRKNGHEYLYNRRLLTLFSAPFYSGHHTNRGSVAKVSKTLKIQIFTLMPRNEMKVLKQEEDRKTSIMAVFDPLQDVHTVTCQQLLASSSSSAESTTSNKKYIGQEGMFAHDTKYCRKNKLIDEKPKSESFSLDQLRKRLIAGNRSPPKRSSKEKSSKEELVAPSSKEDASGKKEESEDLKTVGK